VIEDGLLPGNPTLRLMSEKGTPQYFFTGRRGFTHPPSPQNGGEVPILPPSRWYRLDLTAQITKRASLTFFVFLYDSEDVRSTITLGRAAAMSEPTPLSFVFLSPEHPARYRLGMRLSGDGTACVSGLRLFVYERTSGEQSVAR
jgi:hypothetical protein